MSPERRFLTRHRDRPASGNVDEVGTVVAARAGSGARIHDMTVVVVGYIAARSRVS